MVYEGERGMAKDNEFLGSFTLYGLPPKPKGQVKLEDTFEIDADGLLHVSSRCLDSGTQAKTTIKKRDGHLTDEMIDLLLVDARKYAESDKMAVKQANDRVLMQLDVERVHIQKEYEHNVSIMAERQKRFNDEIQKRDEEFEKMKNSFAATNKKMMEENRKDKKKLQEDLKKNEKRYRQEVDKFEQKISRLEKSYGDRLDEQKRELQEAQQRDHLEFKKKQEREHLAYKEEKDEEIGRLRKEIVDERELNKRRENEFMKIIDKKNYEDKYPKPDLIESHQKINPRACYIQMLGARGSGKSTLLNEIVGDDVAETGTKETTSNTAFFNITPYVQSLPKQYDQVFVVDQPGIGGLEVTEARYLSKYGPGHFNLTLLLCKDGFNELELQLLRHLIFNKKPVVIIRSKCDCDIKGIRRKNRAERMTRDEAVEFLKTEFHQYFREKVLPKVSGMRELQKPEIYFIGLDGDGVSYDDYPDYERLTNQIFNGSMLHKLAENEAKNYKDLKNRSESVVAQNSPDYSNMAIVPYGQVTNPNVESQRSSSSGWFNVKLNPFA